MKNRDLYNLALEVVSEIGLGGDVIGEFSRRKRAKEGLLATPNMPNLANTSPISAPISGGVDTSTAQQPVMPQNAQNGVLDATQSNNNQMEGQGAMNLP